MFSLCEDGGGVEEEGGMMGWWRCYGVESGHTAQWEFGRPTLTPTYLEDKTEVKIT